MTPLMTDAFLGLALGSVLGLALGFLSATVSESFGHKIFGHPAAWQLKLYFKYPRLFAPFLKCYYHHNLIHHERTFRRDLFTQFESDREKAEVDRWISREFPSSFASLVWLERYNLTLKGAQGIVPFAIPFLAGPLLIALAFGKLAFFASLFVAFLPVLLSKYLHPIVHQPGDVAQAGWLVRKVARTRYMRWMIMNHYLHHRHPESNFNLLPGGDRILGLHRAPSAGERAELDVLWKRFEEVCAKS